MPASTKVTKSQKSYSAKDARHMAGSYGSYGSYSIGFRPNDTLIQVNAPMPPDAVAFRVKSAGDIPMSGGEAAYLIMVLVAVTIFAVTLAWASWHSS